MPQRSRLGRLALLAVGFLTLDACAKDPKQFLASGNAYFEQHKYDEAIVQYRNAINRDQKFGEAHAKLADTYVAIGDMRNSLREYVRAADLLPNNTDLQLKAGTGLLLGGQFQDAAARAQKALDSDPQNARAHILLGNALAGLQDFGGALQQLGQTISENPADGLAYASLGYIEAARGDLKSAETALKTAIDVAPDSVDAQLAIGDFYWATNRQTEAARFYDRAIAIEPKNLQANRRQVLLCVTTGRMADAEKYARAVSNSGTGRDKLALPDYYLLAGRPKDAIALLETIAAGSDGAVEAKIRLAGLDLADGRAQSALTRANSVLEKRPNHSGALVIKAQALTALGKVTDAQAIAKQATIANPGSAEAFMTFGRICRALNQGDEAIKAYTEALKLNPRSIATMLELSQLNMVRGGTAGAVQFARQAVRNDPDNPMIHVVLADALKADGNFADARTELKALEAKYPNSVIVQLHEGELFLTDGDIPAASRAFTRAAALDTNSLEAFGGLVAIDLASNHPQDAKAKVEARLARTPDNPSVLMIAANVYYRNHDTVRVEQTLKRVVEIAPGNLDAFRMLGQVLMKQQRLDEARVEFERVVKQNPKAVGTRTAVAVILGLEHKDAEAIKQYEETLRVDPTAAIAANNLAYMYSEQGDPKKLDAALKLAQMARARLSDRPEVSDTLGWIYFKENMVALAIPQLQESVQKDPGNAGYHYHLGMALTKTKNLEGARRQLEQALKLKPDFDGADEARKTLKWLPAASH